MIKPLIGQFEGRTLLLTLIGLLVISYLSSCAYLYIRQRQLIFRPKAQIAALPSLPNFKLPYEAVWIPISGSHDRLHGWWVPAPSPQETFEPLPQEPANILKSPKVILFLCGAGGNKSFHLPRIEGFRQLDFSTFVVDYRGFGFSQGNFPSESQLYRDSQIALDYLIQDQRIPPEQILIYGESLGGAIALDLAVKRPEVSGLIMQSTFTSMAAVIQRTGWLLRLFPIKLLLTQRFDSISKVRSLQVPVLFLHGTGDGVVPAEMSQQLYQAAPEPKQLLLIPDASHYSIYRPGNNSYLRAIQTFMETVESRQPKASTSISR